MSYLRISSAAGTLALLQAGGRTSVETAAAPHLHSATAAAVAAAAATAYNYRQQHLQCAVAQRVLRSLAKGPAVGLSGRELDAMVGRPLAILGGTTAHGATHPARASASSPAACAARENLAVPARSPAGYVRGLCSTSSCAVKCVQCGGVPDMGTAGRRRLRHSRGRRSREARWLARCSTGNGQRLLWRSKVSRQVRLEEAVEEALSSGSRGDDDPQAAEIAIVFVSSAYKEPLEQLVPLLRDRLPSLRHVFGATGFGIIGDTPDGPREVENAPALSVTLATLPKAHVSVQHLSMNELPDGDAPPSKWQEAVQTERWNDDTIFIVLADPSFSRLDDLLAGLDFAFPSCKKIGGLASSSQMSRMRALFSWTHGQDEKVPAMHRSGAVVVVIHEGVVMDLVVAQGCRPLSQQTYTIEQAKRTHVLTLANAKGNTVPPAKALEQDLLASIGSPDELRRILMNLQLGLGQSSVIEKESTSEEFLIRAFGFDKAGTMMVGDEVRVGQRCKFMVRDKVGAQQDLQDHLLRIKRKELQANLEGKQVLSAFGVLLFTCNGRASGLYGEPHYESTLIQSYLPVSCSGFMCNGEIGTVGSSTKLHGFTATAAVLRPAEAPLQESK